MTSLKNIAQKMQETPQGSFRYHVLQAARDFKTSWIGLGQALHSVWKEKRYKEWGYLTFEGYIAKEIGIKKLTAMKLLRSYYFLEREEPAYLMREKAETAEAATIPGFEAVDVLRMAKDKKSLAEADYSRLKKNVFENGLDAKAVKKDLVAILRSREEKSPEEAKEQNDRNEIRAILGKVRILQHDLEILKVLPSDILDLAHTLARRVEEEFKKR